MQMNVQVDLHWLHDWEGLSLVCNHQSDLKKLDSHKVRVWCAGTALIGLTGPNGSIIGKITKQNEWSPITINYNSYYNFLILEEKMYETYLKEGQ